MREKAQVLSEFWIKMIAIFFMTLDHVGIFLMYYFASNSNAAGYIVGFVFRCVGRISFPLFAFMMAEGIKHSHSPLKYLGKIAIVWAVCLIAQSIMVYGFSSEMSNVASPLTDLLFCGLSLYCLTLKKWKKLFAIIPVGIILLSYGVQLYEGFSEGTINVIWLPQFARCGYSLYALLISLGFFYSSYIAKAIVKKSLADLGPTEVDAFMKSGKAQSLSNLLGITFFVAFTVIFWGLHYAYQPVLAGVTHYPLDPYDMPIGTYALLGIFFLVAYNGKRGYDGKAFRIVSYSYFPVHIVIIFVIFRLIFGY